MTIHQVAATDDDIAMMMVMMVMMVMMMTMIAMIIIEMIGDQVANVPG